MNMLRWCPMSCEANNQLKYYQNGRMHVITWKMGTGAELTLLTVTVVIIKIF
jgi:hypothetical protein